MRDFGFTDVQLKIALRPEPRLGDDATWDKAEDALRAALRAAGVEWQELPGEGAFYGPKIEYHLKDAIGRTWQLGTMQVDFMMPGRLGRRIRRRGQPEAPPGDAAPGHRRLDGALHRHPDRAPCRAISRPGWRRCRRWSMNITDAQADWVEEVRKTLANQGVRVAADLRNEKIGYKIREHTLQRVPYLLVVGDREKDNGAVAVRTRGGEDLGTMSVAEFASRLREEHAVTSNDWPGRPSRPARWHSGDRNISTPEKQNRKNHEIRVPARARDRQRWRNDRRAVARRSAAHGRGGRPGPGRDPAERRSAGLPDHGLRQVQVRDAEEGQRWPRRRPSRSRSRK